jgi:glutamate formiminotransferase
MRVLASPNWSFGRDRRLLSYCAETLHNLPLSVHYCSSDIDHNRTVTTFSGEQEAVEEGLLRLCDLVLPSIDLTRHVGVHPRIGALDVCPFTPLAPFRTKLRERRFRSWVESIGATLASRFDLPLLLYEKSEKGLHESDLPTLRKGGFGGMIGREIPTDFGPPEVHPLLGVTVLGWRDFLIAVNSHVPTTDLAIARSVSRMIRELRSNGDPRMLGVRTMPFLLASQDATQVSVNVTLPDLTPVDPILEFVERTVSDAGLEVTYHELIGALADSHLEGATRLHPRPEQIVRVEAAARP